MKKFLIKSVFFLFVVGNIIAIIPSQIYSAKAAPGGNNVTCYHELTIGDNPNISVYFCNDCKRSLCTSYSNKDICYFKFNTASEAVD